MFNLEVNGFRDIVKEKVVDIPGFALSVSSLRCVATLLNSLSFVRIRFVHQVVRDRQITLKDIEAEAVAMSSSSSTIASWSE